MSEQKTEDLVRNLQGEAATTGPRPGDRYRHYKGDYYFIVARSIDEDRLIHLVTYCSEKHGYVWTRTLENFIQPVDGKPRFELVQ